MTNITKQLQNGICELKYTDEHSVEQIISVTLCINHLPDGGTPFNGTPTKYSITMFNLLSEEWQTIQLDAIVDIEQLTGHDAPSNEKKLKASEEYLESLTEEF